MGLIRMDSIQVTDKIHIDDLRSLDMVNIDVLIHIHFKLIDFVYMFLFSNM